MTWGGRSPGTSLAGGKKGRRDKKKITFHAQRPRVGQVVQEELRPLPLVVAKAHRVDLVQAARLEGREKERKRERERGRKRERERER